MRHQPAIRAVPPYYNHPAYIGALAHTLRAQLEALPWTPDKIIASYHGLPKAMVDMGDPYQSHCMETSRLLREKMGMSETDLLTTFQSRLGRAEWLKPYTADNIERLAGEGVKNLLVITPAFAADCLETLEEIQLQNRDLFLERGGEQYHYIPCLNDREDHIEMMANLVRPYLLEPVS
jgi:ferrochelatase